jgi:DNA-binding response OmpR family regulator
MQVVIVSARKEALRDFAQGLGADVQWIQSPADVLGQAKGAPWKLLVIDALTPGLNYKTFAMDLLRVNAMINTVVVTGMGEEEFHEDSEGLGVLCAVPENPGREDGVQVVGLLRQLPGLG